MINDFLKRYQTLFVIMSVLVLTGTVAVVGLRLRPPEPITIQPPLPTATPGPVQVYVSGAVINPDVYTLPAEAIVQDAITAAGGATGEALLEAINLARPLTDGEQIAVPAAGDAPPPAASGDEGQPPAVTGPININTATQAELETLPGIGPVTAQAIIDHRNANGPFEAIEAIQDVRGIGPATFADIQDLITVR